MVLMILAYYAFSFPLPSLLSCTASAGTSSAGTSSAFALSFPLPLLSPSTASAETSLAFPLPLLVFAVSPSTLFVRYAPISTTPNPLLVLKNSSTFTGASSHSTATARNCLRSSEVSFRNATLRQEISSGKLEVPTANPMWSMMSVKLRQPWWKRRAPRLATADSMSSFRGKGLGSAVEGAIAGMGALEGAVGGGSD
ncbi:hypothetical protein P152DRAFT_165492 [Eremomyces bilateralis CBS 781.70]|uniref:Uncharacterized protein n=1 Tax=Eremomyces bilateralis CBS 781.70 TaxID=1392243 RepID=A0A6G1FUQ2_9PEZI|nr:uncharacterized protein P152DRAFT_165492 [Eremomyces bilateralis CBS 781.70]KAF1809428.1 hypothetical protein P152DRAFT_165492 [Eremomyces bilateralis CBS 781.70]